MNKTTTHDPQSNAMLQAAYSRKLNVVARIGNPWAPRDHADDASHTSFTHLAMAYGRLVSSLPPPPNGAASLHVQVGNELNACNEWQCSGPSSVNMSSAQMAQEVAAFVRDIATSLAPLRNGTGHAAWPKGRLKVIHAPISNWDSSPCQCGTEKPLGGGRSGLTFLQAMLDAVPDLYSPTAVDWLSSHAYPYSGEPFGTGRATRGLTYYRNETELVGRGGTMPVILTETGWRRHTVARVAPAQQRDPPKPSPTDAAQQANWTVLAYDRIWLDDPQIVAVCPFLLAGKFWEANGWPWLDQDLTPEPVYKATRALRLRRANAASTATSGLAITLRDGTGFVQNSKPQFLKTDDAVGTNVVRVGSSTAAQAVTIAAGLQLIPPKQTQRWTVEIEPGTYRERVWVNGSMGPVTLLGLSPWPEDTTLVFHCCPKGNGKERCSNESVAAVCGKQHEESLGNTETLLVESDDFTAANITIANDACGYDSHTAAQSQALQANGDRGVFSNVNLRGAQDTIFAYGGQRNTNRQYFHNTTINGSCDAIYGTSTMVFEECDIRMTFTYTADRGGAVQPPPVGDGLGSAAYLFLNSSLRKPLPGDYDYKAGGNSKTFLGRPWGPLAFVVFKDTFMDSHIEPAGWDDWAHSCSEHASPKCKNDCVCNQPTTRACWCQNVTYAEFGSHGPGATASRLKERVGWSRQLSKAEASDFTTDFVLRGWKPASWQLKSDDRDATTPLSGRHSSIQSGDKFLRVGGHTRRAQGHGHHRQF